MKKYFVFVSVVGMLSLTVTAQKKTGKAERAPVDTSKFVLVQGGSFMMGTDKPVEKHEGPPHLVNVNSFYLAKTETTFEDYDKFYADKKLDTIAWGNFGRGKQPAIYVSWLDAVAYCNWLSEKEKLSKCYIINGEEVKYVDTAKGYRLPTEAEWEFAARGGLLEKDTTWYAGSNDLNEAGWWKDNSEAKAHPVGQKKPNELGLYDMSGNVWEWVWDVYDKYDVSQISNPRGAAKGPYRVMRGGAWYNYSNYCTVYTRQYNHPGFRQNSIGFRVARSFF